jgi:hypothetical protein
MKNKPYFVWLSLALMTLGAFVYWQKGAASAQHKVLLIVPIALVCLIASGRALIAKTEPSTRVAWVANMGTFIAFEVIQYIGRS